MSEKDQYQRELDVIEEVKDKNGLGKFFGYAKISGPGWLQGAITLGGGSLAGALYLGVLSGYGFLWVQPLAMICGIIMLSAIAYVTLSTGERPLQAINTHLHPLLGWSWVIATIMANIVWTMPQFALGTAAIQQNLFSDAIGRVAHYCRLPRDRTLRELSLPIRRKRSKTLRQDHQNHGGHHRPLILRRGD